MTMTDEELDREWKPNGRRPQSTVARSFSQELMDIFRIDNSIADLNDQVDKRKHQIDTQTNELEAIEARIREMEQRLRRGSEHKPSSGLDQRLASSANSGGSQQPTPANSSRPSGQPGNAPPPLPEKDFSRRGAAQQQQQSKSRPGTARQGQQAVPGALPPTPVASEDGDGEHDA